MKILMIGSVLTVNGGIQRYIQNLLLHLDTAEYQVDLLATKPADEAESAEPSLRAAGVNICWMPPGDKQRLFFYRGFLRQHHDYDIIHFHTTSKVNALACVVLKCCCPKAKLIVHSHIVYPPMTLAWHIAHRIYQVTADYFLACGVAAGRFVFGSKIDKKPNFAVACNAVDKTRFFPDDAARAKMRAALGVGENQRIIGFVGRYNHQKNLTFVLDVFDALHRLNPNCRLVLVGGGEDQPMVDAKIARLGLSDSVTQMGVRHDIPALMNAFDLFLLPSEFEGSPVTLVEAQGCGVPCLASTNVPDDGSVTELVHFLPLEAPLEQWADTANRLAGRGSHKDYWDILSRAGYDLDTAALQIQKLYDRLYDGN